MAGYKLKLSVRGARPALTRTVMVPDTYTLADLHGLILRAMGWSDFHLHEFEVGYRTIAPEGSELMNVDPDLTEERVHLSDIRGEAFEYIYDFGDDWHVKVSWLKGDGSYDKPCATYIKGTGADPPEDCGGVYAYNRIVEAASDPEDPEHERIVEMFGCMRYDPDEVAYRVRPCRIPGSSSRAAACYRCLRRSSVRPASRRRTSARRAAGSTAPWPSTRGSGCWSSWA